MKNAVPLSLLITLFMLLHTSCNSNKNLIAQNSIDPSLPEKFKPAGKLNGDQLIEAMLTQRFMFNKMLIKNGFDPQKQYPRVISILDIASAGTISFNGFDYIIRQNKIVGVKGIKLSLFALTTLNGKMMKLDQIQQYCSEQANLAYQVKKRNLETIKALDRQYFAALRSMRKITSSIATLARKPNPSVSIEIVIAKIKLPDGKFEFKRNFVADAE